MPGAASLHGLPGAKASARGASRRFIVVVGLALGLHAALLLSVRPAPFDGARTASVAARPVNVRMLADPTQAPPRFDPAPAAQRPADPAPAAATPPSLPVRAEAIAPTREHRSAVAAVPPPAAVPGEPRALSEPPREASRPPPVAAANALPPAPDYFQRSSLDTPPHPLQDIDPAYPDEAQLRSGSVVVRLLIGESGDVDTAAVVRANPPGLFDASALAAFGSAKFAPGMRGGTAVKSQLTVEVEFTPMNRGAAVAGRSY